MGKVNKTPIGESYAAEHRRRRNWKSIVAVLSCFVIAGTVGALTLPAITLSQPGCGMEEHQHTPECFGEKKVLTCNAESIGIHQHTDGCFDGEGNVICHYADFVIHEHDENCLDADGNLICSLPEIEEHQHDERCYQPGEETIVDAGHKHSDSCYEVVGKELLCTKEESDGHIHDDSCRSVTRELQCTDPENPEHQHTEDCYIEKETLTCELEEGTGAHHHTLEECYKIIREEQTVCGEIEREPVIEYAEPVLNCEKPEVEAHTHEKKECYKGQGTKPDQWICDKLEVKTHQHTEDCFATEQVITCGKTEHIHDDSCKSEAELSEDEQRQVDDVISTIEGLPPVEEIEAEFARLADDTEALTTYREKITSAVQAAFDEYNALTDAQKATVTNADKLMEYAYLLEAPPAEPEYTAQAGSITASAELLEGTLPANVKFQMNLLSADSAEYADAVRKANACLAPQNLGILDCVLLDIGFADAEGTDAALDGKAKVTLNFAEPILPGLTEAMALHITADGADNVLENAVWDENGITSLTLITDSFSPFLIPRVGGIEERLSGDNAYIYEAQMKMDGYRQAIATGTADWDSNDAPGNDSSAENDILRTFDVATYTASFKTGLRQAAIDAGIAGYRTGTVYFEFILNESAERAQFEPGSMGWLATYEEATYETVVEENRQILRGSFLMTPAAGNDSTIGNSYSELNVAVRALRMKQGETLQPTFTVWLEGNDVDAGVVDGLPKNVVTGSSHSCTVHGEQEYHTITPDKITISAAYSLNLAIEKANASTTSYSDWFDFNTGNTSGDHEALDYGNGRLRGRMNCYGLTLQLVGKSKTNGLKGVMIPEENSTISFDLTLSSTYKPDGKTAVNLDNTVYAPLVWSAGPNLRDVAAQDGRKIGIASDNAGAAAPYNIAGNGTANQCVKDGGTWYFTQDGWNPRVIHVTVENFVIDLSSLSNFPANKSGNGKTGEDCDYYNFKNESIKNAWDIQLACFSGGEFWTVSPLEAKADGTNYKNIEAYYGNGSLNFDIRDSDFELNNVPVDQAITTDDQRTDGVGLTNPGSYQTDIYYTKYGQGWEKPLTEDCFYNGLDWATPGQKMSVFHLLSCDNGEGNARGAAMEMFAKFDDAFFEPDGTYNVTFFCPMTGSFQYGKPTYKVSWVARGDGYGWNHYGLDPDEGAGTGNYTDYDWNMIQAWPDQIYYYDSLDALKADGKVCIGAFLEVRGITGPGMNHIEFTINGQVKEDCEPNYVYMTTPYAAIYTVGDLSNAARTYWNKNGKNYTYGNSDASFRWEADKDELIDKFVKEGMKWRSDERMLATYLNSDTSEYVTQHNGNYYGKATPTFERRVGTSSGDSKSNELSTMKKTSYKNGVTTGTHDRFLLDSCLVTSHVTAIRKTTVQTTTQNGITSAKKTYSLDMGQRAVDFSLTPSVTRTLGSGPAGDNTTYTNITIVDTLPAELSYIPGTSYWGGTYTQDPKCMSPGTVTGGTKLEPQVKSLSGGRTELCWVLYDVELTQLDTMELPPIYYSCELVGVLEDQQGISNHAEIWSDQDNQRERKTGNNNLAIYGITIQRSSAISLVKLADQSRVELNEDMGFTMSVGNNGNTDYDGIIVDDLPWNGDGRDTSYNGTMTVKDFKVSADLLKKADGGEQLMFFYTTNTAYRGKTSEDYGENYNQFYSSSDWTYLTFGSEKDAKGLVTATDLPANAVQIVGVGTIPAGKVLKMHVTLSLTGDKPGDKVVNQLTLDTLNSKAATTVVGRCLEGLTWIDANHDGIQNNGEEKISGVKVTLLKEDGNGQYQEVKSIQTGQKIDVLNGTAATEYEQGRYLFENLEPGTYAVKFTSGETKITYYYASPVDAGTDDTIDSDATPTYASDSTLTQTLIEGVKLPSKEEMSEDHYHVAHLDSGFYTWGAELPATGGPGTILYTLSGGSLMGLSALMYSKKRKERRKGEKQP